MTAPGTQIGPYRLQQLIGAGGMGEVWQAVSTSPQVDLPTGAEVALKVIRPSLERGDVFLKRFEREARIGLQIRHENVVKTLDVARTSASEDGVAYLVMELILGRTLQALVEDGNPVPEALARSVGIQMAKGLQAIHQVGAIHRDIKPSNLIIGLDHRVHIMDFGVARYSRQHTRLTTTDGFVGSIAHASPEQLRSVAIDHRVDLHAMGLVLYELLSGGPAFNASSLAGLAWQVVSKVPPSLAETNAQVTPFLNEVVARLMAKNPDDRFQSAGSVVQVLTEGEQSQWWRQHAGTLRRERGAVRTVRIAHQAPAIGRAQELAELTQWYSEVTAGESRWVVLQGPGGIGKSRLLDAFTDQLDRTSALVLHGQCGENDVEYALQDALRTVFSQDDAADEISALLRAPALGPALAAWIDQRPLPTHTVKLAPQRLASVLGRLLTALSESGPVVLLLEDLHLATEAEQTLTADVLSHASGPVMAIMTVRPSPCCDRILQTPQGRPLRVEPLSRQDIATLIQRVTDDTNPILALQIADLAEGNPFFAFEALRTQRADRQSPGLPDTLDALMTHRLAQLNGSELALVQLAACAGFLFDPLWIARALGRPDLEVIEQLATLERRVWIFRSIAAQFRFDHHHLRDAVLSRTPPDDLARCHLALADALLAEPPRGERTVRVVAHLLDAGEHKRALELLDDASAYLVQSLQPERQVALVDRFLDQPNLLTGRPRAMVICSKIISMDLRVVDDETMRNTLQEVLSIAEIEGDRTLQARARWQMSKHLGRMGDNQAALLAMEPVRQFLPELEPEAAFLAHVHFSFAYSDMGRLEEALDHQTQALQIAIARGHSEHHAKVLADLGDLHIRMGDLDAARLHLERSRALSLMDDIPGLASVAVSALGRLAYMQGDFAKAEALLEQRLLCAQREGNLRDERKALTNIVFILGAQGKFADATVYAERGALMIDATLRPRGAAIALHAHGTLLWAQGLLAQAATLQKRALHIGEHQNVAAVLPSASWALGCIDLALGREQSALEHVDAGIVYSNSVSNRNIVFDLLGLRADCALQHQQLPNAIRASTACIEGSRKAGNRQHFALDLIRHARIQLATDQAAAALATLDEALRVAHDQSSASPKLAAIAFRATLHSGTIADAVAAWHVHEQRCTFRYRWHAALDLWRATSDLCWLEEANDAVVHLQKHAPPNRRNSMIALVPAYREIALAWAEAHDQD